MCFTLCLQIFGASRTIITEYLYIVYSNRMWSCACLSFSARIVYATHTHIQLYGCTNNICKPFTYNLDIVHCMLCDLKAITFSLHCILSNAALSNKPLSADYYLFTLNNSFGCCVFTFILLLILFHGKKFIATRTHTQCVKYRKKTWSEISVHYIFSLRIVLSIKMKSKYSTSFSLLRFLFDMLKMLVEKKTDQVHHFDVCTYQVCKGQIFFHKLFQHFYQIKNIHRQISTKVTMTLLIVQISIFFCSDINLIWAYLISNEIL